MKVKNSKTPNLKTSNKDDESESLKIESFDQTSGEDQDVEFPPKLKKESNELKV